MQWLYLLALHLLADVVLQPRWMSINKTKKFSVLLSHASVHFLVFLIGLLPFGSLSSILWLSFMNAVAHGQVDWIIWNVFRKRILESNNKNKKLWFRLTIVLDQVTHLSILYVLRCLA